MNVAVLGASDRTDRYSNKAVQMLLEYDHTVYPVHPHLKTIAGLPVFSSLTLIPDPIDTITVYVSPSISTQLGGEIAGVAPRRVIFNPGAENPALAERLRAAGIEVVEACTLVLLRTGRF
ncbi:MAG: CoA-binding protein [Candidatus Sumerlaeia bacterium]